MLQMEFNAPTRTTKYPREIPPLPWYRQTLPQMLMAGFLPFSAIYIELYYIYASVWGELLCVLNPLDTFSEVMFVQIEVLHSRFIAACGA